MIKQVQKTVVEQAPAANSTETAKPANLFISVKTFDKDGKTIGERIVDQYHFGTRNWMQNHLWWAMHNSAEVEIKLATPEEIDAYVSSARAALAEKFNAPVAAEKVAA